MSMQCQYELTSSVCQPKLTPHSEGSNAASFSR
jgi:hypothetical protein